MNPFSDHIQAHAQAAGTPFERVLFIDIESRSELNLRQVDAETYAAHPSTEIICARWAVDDGAISHWDETHFGALLDACPLLANERTLVCVHNAEFEPRMFRHKLGLDIPVERIVDSAAVARHCGLPGDLDNLAGFFGGEKDKLGRAAMLKLTRPRTKTKAHPEVRFWRYEEKPDDFELMFTYCGWDVHWTREAMRYMPPLPQFEIRVYWATYRMNARGFPIDRRAAARLWEIVDETRERMSREIEEAHGFTLSQPAKIAEYLGLDSVAKAPLRDYLKRDDLDPARRRVALARQTFAKTSVDKLKQMLARSRVDGSVHDGIIYGAAERTLRFAGGGVQPQNIPRGIGKKQDAVFEAIEIDGCFEVVFGGEELPTIANVLRGCIAHPRRALNVGDYSQIEARILAWLVGDTALLTVFAQGGDPYKMMAAKIYGKPEEDITDAERFMGKQTVLGCGYGLGPFGFATMLDVTYDVQIDDDEALTLVRAYRKNAPKVVRFWRRLDQALVHASQQVGTEFAIIKGKLSIKFTRHDRFWIKLPSGRVLRYYQVESKTDKKGRVQWSCFGRLKNGAGYGRVKLYGGALTGHIVQSTARDVVARAMVELDNLGHDLVLTVHDELVSLASDDDYGEFEAVMRTPSPWLTEFPLAVEAFQTHRYRK